MRARQHVRYEGSCPFWSEVGISVADVRERVRLGWTPIYEVRQGDDVRPLSVLEPADRTLVNDAFTWVQGVAAKRGDNEQTRY